MNEENPNAGYAPTLTAIPISCTKNKCHPQKLFDIKSCMSNEAVDENVQINCMHYKTQKKPPKK